MNMVIAIQSLYQDGALKNITKKVYCIQYILNYKHEKICEVYCVPFNTTYTKYEPLCQIMNYPQTHHSKTKSNMNFQKYESAYCSGVYQGLHQVLIFKWKEYRDILINVEERIPSPPFICFIYINISSVVIQKKKKRQVIQT